MQPHKVVSREEWIEVRKAHMAREKELTNARDRLAELVGVAEDHALRADRRDDRPLGAAQDVWLKPKRFDLLDHVFDILWFGITPHYDDHGNSFGVGVSRKS